LHVDAFVSVLPLHDAALHVRPLAKSWHAPAPLHEPLVPHVDWACAAHSLSGSVAIVTPPQVPLARPVFAALHAWQSPPQADPQQNPSVQNVLAHWLPRVHTEPVGSGATHAPAMHTLPIVQFAAVMHVVPHAAPLQRYAPQLCVLPATHVPPPLQVDALVSVLPAHEAARHDVPLT
jgi:hypothetical protein